MENKLNVLQQLESGELSAGGCFGFYDWFCTDKSLPARSKRLVAKLNRVLKFNDNKFDPTKVYVFFKNNCPCYGKLYDDFRICDLETGDVLFTITPAMGYDNQYGKASLWGHPDGKTTSEFVEIIEAATWENILIWFGKEDNRAERIAKIQMAADRQEKKNRRNYARRNVRELAAKIVEAIAQNPEIEFPTSIFQLASSETNKDEE